MKRTIALWAACLLVSMTAPAADPPAAFLKARCLECHDADTKKGNLDLSSLPPATAGAEHFARWVKVHDRIASGEMPPKKKARPAPADVQAVTRSLADTLLAATPRPLLLNLAQQSTIYSTGRPLAFSDRAALAELVARTEKQGGGIRTLVHELVQSQLFLTR